MWKVIFLPSVQPNGLAGSMQSIQFKVNVVKIQFSDVQHCYSNMVFSCLSCTDRATLSTIVYFEWRPPVPLKNDAQHLESRLFKLAFKT